MLHWVRTAGPGKIGQASAASSQTVRTWSNSRSRNSVIDFERAQPCSIPASSRTWMVRGLTVPAGTLPADTTATRSPPSWRNSASAMIDRQLLPVHRTRIRIGGAATWVTESGYSRCGIPARDEDELADALREVAEDPVIGGEL